MAFHTVLSNGIASTSVVKKSPVLSSPHLYEYSYRSNKHHPSTYSSSTSSSIEGNCLLNNQKIHSKYSSQQQLKQIETQTHLQLVEKEISTKKCNTTPIHVKSKQQTTEKTDQTKKTIPEHTKTQTQTQQPIQQEKQTHSGKTTNKPEIPIPPTTLQHNGKARYVRRHLLGKGGFAHVYFVEDLDDAAHARWAAKCVAKAPMRASARSKLVNEIKLHRKLLHEHIVGFHAFFEDAQFVYILLQLCPDQTLMELLKRRRRLTEIEVRYYLWQVLDAIHYLHKELVVHRDLKLGNLFLNGTQIKIGDFGLATKLLHPEERKKTLCGTPNYIAPEILQSTGHSFGVDVWAVGVIMFTLLVGQPPFETDSVKSTYRRIRDNSYAFPPHVTVSREAQALIQRILNTDPCKRPTVDEIMNDAWFDDCVESLPLSCLHSEPTEHEMASWPRRLRHTKPSTPVSSACSFSPSSSSSPSRRVLGDCTNMPERSANPGHMTSPLRLLPYSQQIRHPETLSAKRRAQTRAHAALLSSGSTFSTMSNSSAITGSGAIVKTSSDSGHVSTNATPKTNHENNNHCSSDTNSNTHVNDDEPNQQPLQRTTLTTSKDTRVSNTTHDTMNVNASPSTTINVHGTADEALWISKWVDYSSKYGLGYVLCNGVTGMRFNDGSTMLLQRDGIRSHYWARRDADAHPFALKNAPIELQKKTTLLKHFHHYLRGSSTPTAHDDDSTNSDCVLLDLVHVKQWVRTKHAIVFRLSNGSVQAIFHDASEVVLVPGASAAQRVVYTDKQKTRTVHRLDECTARADLAKRMQYTKQVVAQLLKQHDTSDALAMLGLHEKE